jgi:hypothetical protein
MASALDRFLSESRDLTLDDIIKIQQESDSILSGPAAATREQILRLRAEFATYQASLAANVRHESELRDHLRFDTQRLTDLVSSARKLNAERTDLETDIAAAKCKLLTYQNLAKFRHLPKEVKPGLRSFPFGPVESRLAELQAAADFLGFSDEYQKLKDKFALSVRQHYSAILCVTQSSFSLENIGKVSPILGLLDLKGEFVDFLFRIATSQFLSLLKLSQVRIDRERISIEGVSNNQIAYLTHSATLLKQILSSLAKHDFVVPITTREEFVAAGLQIAFDLPVHDRHERNAALTELQQSAGIDDTTVSGLVKNGRVPMVLGRARQLLQEQKPFGEVLLQSKELMDGLDGDLLKQLTMLAIVIWSKKKENLELAMRSIMAVSVPEAFECAMWIDREIRAT